MVLTLDPDGQPLFFGDLKAEVVLVCGVIKEAGSGTAGVDARGQDRQVAVVTIFRGKYHGE